MRLTGFLTQHSLEFQEVENFKMGPLFVGLMWLVVGTTEGRPNRVSS